MNDEDLRKRLDALGSEHGDYRHAVRWFVARGPASLPFLVAALGVEPPGSLRRARIVETLGEIGDAAAVPVLIELIEEPELEREIAQALARIGTGAAEKALIGCLRDPRIDVVKESTKALGLLRSPAAVGALRSQLGHPDPSVRYHAVQSLVEARPGDLDELLRSHLAEERDPDVRRLIESHVESGHTQTH